MTVFLDIPVIIKSSRNSSQRRRDKLVSLADGRPVTVVYRRHEETDHVFCLESNRNSFFLLSNGAKISATSCLFDLYLEGVDVIARRIYVSYGDGRR